MGKNEPQSFFSHQKPHFFHPHPVENPQSIRVAQVNDHSHIKVYCQTCRRKHKKNYHDPGVGKQFLTHLL